MSNALPVYIDHSSCSDLNVDFSMFVSLVNCVSSVFVWDIVYRNCAELSVFDEIVWLYTYSPCQKA